MDKIKFSGSKKAYGKNKENITINPPNTIIPKISLIEKYGWKATLLNEDWIPIGLEDPVLCKNNKWTTTKAKIINGTIKWNVKNRVRVGPLTANPPHSHPTIEGPIYGIADKILVITVAAQNLICPQGSTYPRKAAAIVKSKRTTPTLQVSTRTNDEEISPRLVWRYKQMKNQDAPLAWRARISHPKFTFCLIKTTESNEEALTVA